MAFRPPRSIQVAGHTIKIKMVRGLCDKTGNFGQYRGGQQLVEIDAELPPDLMEETFWHEMIEVYNFIFELKMAHQKIQILGACIQQSLKELRRG